MRQKNFLRQTDNNTKTRRASTEMEFRVNSMSWRLAALSEFLFSKLILKFYRLVNGLYI